MRDEVVVAEPADRRLDRRANPVQRREAVGDQARRQPRIDDEHHIAAAAAAEEAAHPLDDRPGQRRDEQGDHRGAEEHEQPLDEPQPPALLHVALHEKAVGR